MIRKQAADEHELRGYERIVGIIPARMGASRFPGKPLAPLLGRPIIEHVLRRAEMCTQLSAVYVATCDEEIKRVVEALGGRVIMTSPTHERASDRVAEAAEQVKAGGKITFRCPVNYLTDSRSESFSAKT